MYRVSHHSNFKFCNGYTFEFIVFNLNYEIDTFQMEIILFSSIKQPMFHLYKDDQWILTLYKLKHSINTSTTIPAEKANNYTSGFSI